MIFRSCSGMYVDLSMSRVYVDLKVITIILWYSLRPIVIAVIFWKLLALFINPKTAGGEGQFNPPCDFSKTVSSKETVERCFFLTFNIILSHIFPENFIEFPRVVQKIWKNSLSMLANFRQFSSIFWIFWHYLLTKKLMMPAYNGWCQHFFTLNIL